MNIAFYVSGKATRLHKTLEKNNQDLIGSTKLIFSDDEANSYLKEIADKLSINYYCLNYEDIPKGEISRNLNMSNKLLELLQKHDVDYCFSFGDHLLVGDILSQYENKIINFHPSVLPMFPGLMSIDQAVSAGSHLLGNTAHFINPGVDTGPIILQSVVSSKVFHGENYDDILDHQIIMLQQIFEWLKTERVKIKDNVVTVEDANYQQVGFYPAIE